MALGDKGATLDGLKASHDNLDGKIANLKSDFNDKLNTVTDKLVKVTGNNKLLKITVGGWLDNGVFTENENYGTTNRFDVEGGTTLYLFAKNSSEQFGARLLMRYFTFYDNNGDVIPVSATTLVSSFVVPSEAVEAIVSINMLSAAQYHDFMITTNQMQTSYEEPFVYFEASNDFIPDEVITGKKELTGYMKKYVPVNLFANGTDGYMSKTGVVTASNLYFYTNKIKVKSGDSINVFNVDSNDNVTIISRRFLTAFDSDGNVMADAGESASSNSPYIVPNGVDSIVISIPCAGSTPTTHAVKEETMVCANYTPFWYTQNKGDYLVGTSEFVTSANKPLVFLPSYIYVAVGRTIEIYNEQVCINADKFHVIWRSGIGFQYKDKFRIIGTSRLQGREFSCSFELYNDEMNLVYVGYTTIKIVAELNSDKKILPIGDSITRAKNWLSEVYNINNHVLMVGTFEDANIVDSSGNMRTVHHEGRSGFSAKDYIDGNPYTLYGATETPHNKFYNPSTNKFSLNYYSSTYGVTFDAVQIMLGTNGTTMNMEENANCLTQMVDAIRTEYPNLPIIFVYMPFPSDQNGIGAEQETGSADGYSSTLRGVDAYKKATEIYNLLTKIGTYLANYSNIFYAPISQCFSRKYNYGEQDVQVIPRSAETEKIPLSAIHPHAPEGYWQMADVLYSTYCAI